MAASPSRAQAVSRARYPLKGIDRHAATPNTPEVYEAAINRVDRLLRRRSKFADLIMAGWGAKPFKELTESLAVLDVALDLARYSRLDRGDSSVTVLVVGDGHSPRTGALVAMETGWTVTSIDPVLSINGAHPRIARLTCIRAQLEDRPDLRARLVLAPHSHAPPELTRRAASGGGQVVSMPCCVPWPLHAGVETRACVARDRTIYIEMVP